jgi:hypothetical protein
MASRKALKLRLRNLARLARFDAQRAAQPDPEGEKMCWAPRRSGRGGPAVMQLCSDVMERAGRTPWGWPLFPGSNFGPSKSKPARWARATVKLVK